MDYKNVFVLSGNKSNDYFTVKGSYSELNVTKRNKKKK